MPGVCPGSGERLHRLIELCGRQTIEFRSFREHPQDDRERFLRELGLICLMEQRRAVLVTNTGDEYRHGHLSRRVVLRQSDLIRDGERLEVDGPTPLRYLERHRL